jgi:hypothetical protein
MLFFNSIFGVFSGTYFFYVSQIYKLSKPFDSRIMMNIYLIESAAARIAALATKNKIKNLS